MIDVVRADITQFRADAIVNAAKSSLMGGGGVDGSIHRAGGPSILDACKLLRATTLPRGLDVGAAVATTAGRLPAQWVIHTVGPKFSTHEDRTNEFVAAYQRSLLLARSLGLGSIAFPLISGGSYGWPMHDAVAAQVRAVKDADVSVDLVTLVAFSRDVAELTERMVGAR